MVHAHSVILTLLFIFATLTNPQARAWNTPAIKAQGAGGSKQTSWLWTGAGGNADWNNGANWCGSLVNGACQGQSTPPPVTASVVFDNICSIYSNCTPTLPGSIEVRGFNLMPNYPGTFNLGATNLIVRYAMAIHGGTFNQGSGTITIAQGNAAGTFDMTGGAFNGGTGTFTVGAALSTLGNGYFRLNGGTFRAPSTTLSLAARDFDFTGGTFQANGGLAELHIYNWTLLNGSSPIPFHDVKITGVGSGHVFTLNQDMTLSGNLTLACEVGCGTLPTNFLIQNKNIIMNAGSVYNTGYAIGGTSIIKFTGVGAQVYDNSAAANGIVPGIEIASTAVSASTTFLGPFRPVAGMIANTALGTINVAGASFTFNGNSGARYDTPNFVFPTLNITDALHRADWGTINVIDLTIGINTGTHNDSPAGVFNIYGNLAMNGYFYGEHMLNFVGTGPQTVTTGPIVNYFNMMPSFRVDKPSGTLSFAGNPPAVAGNFTYIRGGFTMPSNFIFNATRSLRQIAMNGLEFNNVTFSGTSSSAGYALADDWIIRQNISFETTGSHSLSSPTLKSIVLYGNISAAADSTGFSGITGEVRFVGTNHTVDFPGTSTHLPDVVIANDGTITFTGNIRIAGNAFTHNSGTVVATGATFIFDSTDNTVINAPSLPFANVAFRSARNISITGGMTVNGNLSLNPTVGGRTLTGTINCYGNFESIDIGYLGTPTINLRGNDSSFRRTSLNFITSTINVNKNAGQVLTVLESSTMSNNQSMNLQAGQIRLATPITTFAFLGTGQITFSPGTSIKLDGGQYTLNGTAQPSNGTTIID